MIPADQDGFISVDDCLRCAGGPHDVFAVGDVASSATHPRPKAGVFAVRQGPVLSENLRRCEKSSLDAVDSRLDVQARHGSMPATVAAAPVLTQIDRMS